MRITNKHNLPEAVFNFIAEDRYNPGSSDYSVTTIISPPQLVALRRRYHNHLEEDVMDRIWSVFGTAVHNLFEAHTKDGVAEERLYADIFGARIGGQMDHVQDGVITDYKVTSAYKVQKEIPLEWIQQQNIYRYLQHVNGREITKLQICAILRDWSRSKARQDPSYPQTPVQIIQLPMWTLDETKAYLEERVSLHLENETLEDHQLTPCTSEEMWESPTRYAVMERGKKRAVKLYDSLDEAESAVKGTQYIELRPGARPRCADFCPVAGFCHQYKEYLNAHN